MDNYSPADPLRTAGTVHGDSRPHSSLLDAFSGDLSREESASLGSKEVSSFGANCPAVFVVPMGSPLRMTKKDLGSSTLTSGIASMTRQTEEEEDLGSWDTANRAPTTFYSHRDSAFGSEPGADLLTPDPNSTPSRGIGVEEHYQLAHSREGDGQERGTGRVHDVEDDIDLGEGSHGHLEDLHPNVPVPPIASTTVLPSKQLIMQSHDLEVSVDQTQEDGGTLARQEDASLESMHTMHPTVEHSPEDPSIPMKTDHPHHSRETDHLDTPRVTDHPQGPREIECPHSLTETDRPHSPTGTDHLHQSRQTVSAHSPKEVDYPHSPTETDQPHGPTKTDCPHSPTETDRPHSPTETDRPHSPTETDRPHSPTETDRPHSLTGTDHLHQSRQTVSPHSPKELDYPHSPMETDRPHSPTETDRPHSPTETDRPQSPTETDHPHSPTETDHPHSPTETDRPHCPTETDRPHSPTETDRPHSPTETDHLHQSRQTVSPHSPKEVDYPHCPTETDRPHSSTGTDQPHSPTGTDHPHYSRQTDRLHSPTETDHSYSPAEANHSQSPRLTHFRPIKTLDKQSEGRSYRRDSASETPHPVSRTVDCMKEGSVANTSHCLLSPPTVKTDDAPPLYSNVEQVVKLVSTNERVMSTNDVTSGAKDHHLGSLSDPIEGALHAAHMELEQAVLDRARLAGQLEAVMAESQSVLGERAALQTKVAQLEAQLSANNSGGSQSMEGSKSGEIVSLKEKVVSITAKYQSMQTALDRERKVTEELRNKLRLHKISTPSHSLGTDQSQVARLNQKVADLETELVTLREELNCKGEELSKACQKLTMQTSASESLERTNTWLKQQLDETMASKSTLQTELHEARAGSISQSIGLNQTRKEVALYQQQISELQKALWKEKAQMVKNLEVIEADVLSKESYYQVLMQDKLTLSDKCARMEVETSALRKVMEEIEDRVLDLEGKLAASQEEVQTVTSQLGRIEAEKAALAASAASSKAELERRSEEITALNIQLSSVNDTLQAMDIRLKQKDVEMASTASDKELVERQRDAAVERQGMAEAELEHARELIADLEGRLEVLDNSAQESEEGLQAVTASHKSLTLDVNQLRIALAEKEDLLAQRTQQVQSVEQQVSELLAQFHTLQQQYDVTDSVRIARDCAIQGIVIEKETLEVQLAQWKESFGKLEQEKARLEGEVDALTQQTALTGDISQLSKEKMHFQTELNAERVRNQHEMLQLQAKIHSLETELKTSRKESSDLEKRIQQLNWEKSAAEEDKEMRLQELHAELSRVRQQAHELAQEKCAWQKDTEKANSSLSGESELLREENHKVLLAKQRLDIQFKELQERGQREMELLRQKAEDEKRSLISKVQQLSIEVERYRGRLAGMGHSQVTMKRHAEALEEALADRESAFAKLSQRVINEKEVEDSNLLTRIGLLENELETRRLDIESLSSQLSGKDAEIELLAEELSRRGDKINVLQQTIEGLEAARVEVCERLVELEREDDQLRLECSSLKSKLASQVSVVESYQLGIKEKVQQVDILTKELHAFKMATEEVQTEIEKLKEYHKVAEERQQAEVMSLQKMLDETLAERNSLRERLLARAQGSTSSPRHHSSPLSSPSLSSIHSGSESVSKQKYQLEQDETGVFVGINLRDEGLHSADLQAKLEKVEAVNDSLRQSGQAAVGQVLVYHQLMRRQEEDMTKRLEEAWLQGQEVAENKKSAEIAVLKDELGYKHNSLDALRKTLSSLRHDMGKLQSQMDKHSLAASASSHSSRELECRLKDLRRVSRIPSNHSSWRGSLDTPH